jgi:hypothetical protein
MTLHILLMYPGGRQQNGLLLARTRERMRVMMPGQADAVEFRMSEGVWMGESGATVEIAAILAASDGAPADSAALRAGSPRLSAGANPQRASLLQH